MVGTLQACRPRRVGELWTFPFYGRHEATEIGRKVVGSTTTEVTQYGLETHNRFRLKNQHDCFHIPNFAQNSGPYRRLC